jgi:hypothetical protein
MFGNKVKIVLLAVTFNILFEYSMRGFAGLFLHKWLIVLLPLLYFAYFMVVDSLIRKYRITNAQFLVVAFCFGVLVTAFFSGNIFVKPTLFGVNILWFLFVNIVWWGFIQGLMTFYLATSLAKRDWSEKPMGKRGFFLSTIFIGAFLAFTFFAAGTPKGTLEAYVFILVLFALGFLYLKKRLQKPQQDIYAFYRSRFLDILSYGTAAAFVLSGTFVATVQTNVSGSLVSLAATQLMTIWTALVCAGIIGYYLINKRQITI